MNNLTRNETKSIRSLVLRGLGLSAMIAILMLSFSSVQALDDEAKAKQKLGQEITKMMDYPESIMLNSNIESGVVVLYFYLSPNGEIKVLRAEGLDASLNNYVSNTLDGTMLVNHLDYETQRYEIPIQFKLQK